MYNGGRICDASNRMTIRQCDIETFVTGYRITAKTSLALQDNTNNQMHQECEQTVPNKILFQCPCLAVAFPQKTRNAFFGRKRFC